LLFAAGGVCVGLLSFASSVNPIYPLIGISIGSGTIPGCLWYTFRRFDASLLPFVVGLLLHMMRLVTGPPSPKFLVKMSSPFCTV
jgi:hypothetical protein